MTKLLWRSILLISLLMPLLGYTQKASAPSTDLTEVVINGNFEKNYEPWYSQELDSKGRAIRAPEMISIETKDTPDKSAGALRLTFKKKTDFKYYSHRAGAFCKLSDQIPGDRDTIISLWAKSLGGAKVLAINRPGGGGCATVPIDNAWKKYELIFHPSFATQSLIFNLVPKNKPGIQRVSDGECLIDNLSVQTKLPKITAANVKYGPHKRQVFDFWRAPGTKNAPVLVFIHGGGWLGGSKDHYPGFRAMVDRLHRRGISVANVNYRLSSDKPLPAPVHDAARAIQMLRSKAKEWGIDKKRIAATGGSAGGCTVLWLATHDDLADPKSADPIARESTRLCGVVAGSAQTTIDPVVIRRDVYETALNHSMICRAAGFPNNKAMDAGYDKAAALYREFSPINHLSPDDPPILLRYQGPVTDPKEGIHSSRFGVIFKKRADEVGAPCYLKVNKNPKMFPKAPNKWEFIYKVLKVDTPERK